MQPGPRPRTSTPGRLSLESARVRAHQHALVNQGWEPLPSPWGARGEAGIMRPTFSGITLQAEVWRWPEGGGAEGLREQLGSPRESWGRRVQTWTPAARRVAGTEWVTRKPGYTGAPGVGGSVGSASDFGSGHDLTVHRCEPRVGLCADSSEPGTRFGVCVSLSLCPSPAHALFLSQK